MTQPAPLTLAMADWDYSWLLRTSGRHEDAYHLLPRRMEELAERGFNALRVDAWPHLVAAEQQADAPEEFVILPNGSRDSDRGSRRARRVSPSDRLLRLAQSAKANGISLWLTSWLLPDTRACRSQIRTPADFVRIWHETLLWLEQAEVLDAVVAVDFAHQFPDKPAGYGAWQHLFHRTPLLGGRRRQTFPASTIGRLNAYLVEVPRQLRTLYPQLQIGLSMQSQLAGRMKQLDLAELDFLDLHLTPSHRKHQRDQLGDQLHAFRGFCEMHQMALALGAGSHQLPRTRHLPDICRLSEQGVQLALEAGVGVINPCYYARPQNPVWNEVSWLQQVNRHIRERTQNALAVNAVSH